jgi:hypothetical protein
MVKQTPKFEKLVHSEFTNGLVPIASEAWRHECEVAFFLGLPAAKREEMLEGSADGTDLGMKVSKGESAVAMLRLEIARLVEIRRGKIAP